MALFNSKGTAKGFLVTYVLGLVSFFGLLIGVMLIFEDPDVKGINADGSIDLGPPQTYFEAMFSIGPGTMLIAMLLSSILVYAMTNLRKGIEALVIGLLCTFLIGGFVTMNIEQALSNNLNDAGASNLTLEIKDRAIHASHLFVGNLFLWANFFLEVIRFKPKKSIID